MTQPLLDQVKTSIQDAAAAAAKVRQAARDAAAQVQADRRPETPPTGTTAPGTPRV